MAKIGSVVASKSLSGSGRRSDVGTVDGRIAKKWFVRERKWVNKTFGINGVSFGVSLEPAPLEVQQPAG